MAEENVQWQELRINLRGSQHAFLKYLSSAAEVEVSEIFRQLLEFAGPAGKEQSDTELDEIARRYRPKPPAADHRANKWKRVSVHLDPEHIRLLRSLAKNENVSESNFLRHLLKDLMERSSAGKDMGGHRFSKSFQRFLVSNKSKLALLTIFLIAAVLAVLVIPSDRGSSVKVGPHWAGNEADLILDPHTHTSFSDGALSPTELVEMAVQNGCNALVVSDHSDRAGTVSDQQILELQKLRANYPDLLLFNGIELNMPSYGGREHAGLIADPLVETSTLQQLRDVAERSLRRARNAGASSRYDRQLLKMIADYQSLRNGLLLVYHHPSRKDVDIAENLSDLTRWNSPSPVFAAIEGAPGHQNDGVIGSYQEPYLTEDRWDPVVAEIGGVWDQLLSDGHQLWGALASSDYHNERMDEPPCAFARTHVIAPEWSYRGVLRALHAGTFWADHGRILDQLQFSVEVEGLEQSAYPGYTVHVSGRDSQAVLNVSIKRGPGSTGKSLTVEFIGNCRSGDAEILSMEEIGPGVTEASAMIPLAAVGEDQQSCTVRARVRLSQETTVDLLAYTNPIRLVLD